MSCFTSSCTQTQHTTGTVALISRVGVSKTIFLATKTGVRTPPSRMIPAECLGIEPVEMYVFEKQIKVEIQLAFLGVFLSPFSRLSCNPSAQTNFGVL